VDSQGRQYMHWKTCAHPVPPKRVVLNLPISYAQTTLWAILPPTSRDWPIFSPFVYVSPLRSPLFCPRPMHRSDPQRVDPFCSTTDG